MRKVELRMNENHKYEIIKKLVDNNGNKKRAAIELNCSIRTIDRLISTYKTKGKADLYMEIDTESQLLL